MQVPCRPGARAVPRGGRGGRAAAADNQPEAWAAAQWRSSVELRRPASGPACKQDLDLNSESNSDLNSESESRPRHSRGGRCHWHW